MIFFASPANQPRLNARQAHDLNVARSEGIWTSPGPLRAVDSFRVRVGRLGRDGLRSAREARGARRGDPRCHVQSLALAPVETARACIRKSPTRSSPSWRLAVGGWSGRRGPRGAE